MKKLLLVGTPDSIERRCMRRVFQILNNEAETIFVPKVKPSLTFCTSIPFSINDIFSDSEESKTPEHELETRVD